MEQIKPGLFTKQVAADSRRSEFDGKNEQILNAGRRPDFVFIGDSITHGWELSLYFGGSGKLIVNRGIGGDIPYYISRRFAADVLQLSPGCAVVLCGINETWGFEACDGEEALTVAYNETIERIIKPLREIAAACQHSLTPLALCSILPIYGLDTSAVNARKRLIVAANKEIQALCSGHKAIYVDYHTALCEEDGLSLRPALSPDGCHMNGAGYQAMASVLRDTLCKSGYPID